MRIVSTPLAATGLTRIGMDRNAQSQWFEPVPQNAEGWRARAELIRNSLVTKDWLTALAPAFNASGAAAERLERAAKSGVAVTAGQQPGLFGGPLYTWWKAFSALSLANRLEAETGMSVVPVFWAATDDSDHAEAAATFVVTNEGASRIALDPREDTGRALAEIPLGDVSAQLDLLVAATGSAPNGAILDLLRSAYSPGRTIGSAYLELLRGVLEPMGIAVIDASDPSVRSAAFPVLKQALLQSEQIEDSLFARSAEFKAQKLSAQVKVVKGRTLVFAIDDGVRNRVTINDARKTATSAAVGDLGPNVLLRPIVERSILPTVAYVGGPAEIAYFAQVTAVADAMATPRPLIVPRWSGTVIEQRVEKTLDRYALTVDDFRDPHAVETKMARESLSADLMSRLQQLRNSVEVSANELASDPGAATVPRAVIDGLTRNVSHRIDRLERRFVAAVKRNGNDALREIAIARGSLYPDGTPQERALNFIPLLARYGDDIIVSALAEIEKHTVIIW